MGIYRAKIVTVRTQDPIPVRSTDPPQSTTRGDLVLSYVGDVQGPKGTVIL